MLNLDDKGKPVAAIMDGNNIKKIVSVIGHFDNEKKPTKEYENIHLDKGRFLYYFDPIRSGFRISWYICGMPGSGKSYLISDFLKNSFLPVMPPRYPIYLFTEKEHDEAFDGIPIKKITINDSIVSDPFNYNEFANSMCIFDDVDAIGGPIGAALIALRDKLIKNARSIHSSVIATNHELCEGRATKILLTQTDAITFFMHTYNRSMRYLCENYIGLSKEAVKTLRSNKTRATTLIRTVPQIIMQEKDIYMLSKLENKI